MPSETTGSRNPAPDETRNRRTSSRALPVFWYSWACFLLFLLPGPAQAGSDSPAGHGSVRGKVLVTRKLTSQRMRFRLYQDVSPQPPPTAMEERQDEWRNIVIYLETSESMPALNGSQGDNPQITQLGETFFPHVLPVFKGTTVEFPNEDPIFHNVFSLSRTKSFDLGRYPMGVSRSVTFEKPGLVPVFCHLHSDMSAIVLVLDNPYFSVPDNSGEYRIENIPAGVHTIVAWHERSERVELSIEIKPGEETELNIKVPLTDEETSEP